MGEGWIVKTVPGAWSLTALPVESMVLRLQWSSRACGASLCVRQVGPVGDLRGDTGAPAHGLLAAPPGACPPQTLRAVLQTSASPGAQGTG